MEEKENPVPDAVLRSKELKSARGPATIAPDARDLIINK